MSAVWPAQLTANAFSRLGQYASSPGNSAYCYAELAVSSPAMAVAMRLPKEGWPGWVDLGS